MGPLNKEQQDAARTIEAYCNSHKHGWPANKYHFENWDRNIREWLARDAAVSQGCSDAPGCGLAHDKIDAVVYKLIGCARARLKPRAHCGGAAINITFPKSGSGSVSDKHDRPTYLPVLQSEAEGRKHANKQWAKSGSATPSELSSESYNKKLKAAGKAG